MCLEENIRQAERMALNAILEWKETPYLLHTAQIY